MKQLSIEEKAKAYDEAIERATNIYTGRYKPEKAAIVAEILEDVFPELKENEDERIRKELIELLKEEEAKVDITSKRSKTLCKYIVWLEKQGEQKPIPKFTVGDKIWHKIYKGGCVHHIIRVENGNYIGDDNTSISILTADKEYELVKNQGEQNPADKVEPKFRIEVGKWYICISQYCNCIEGRCYQATSDGRIIDDFGTEYDMHSDADRYFRLWTIQDAKDGDVLASEDKVFLYNGKLDLRGRVCAYCGIYKTYDGLRFTKCAIGNYFTYKEPYPATEEQRNALMKAMTDAGYTFDFENKELEKIIDEKQIKKNLQDNSFRRMFEQKPAWSEEDELMLTSIIQTLKLTNGAAQMKIDWLKSLRPQNRWKPSQDPIMYLYEALNIVKEKDMLSIATAITEVINHLKEEVIE